MTTAKDFCLGIALAGVLAGAGTALGCAVASADTGSDTSAGSAAGAGKTRVPTERGAGLPGRSASKAGGVPPAKRTAASSTLVSARASALPPGRLPLPAPVLPAAPASPVSLTASASRGRTASQIASPTHVLLIGTDGTNLSKVLEYAYDDPTDGFRMLMDDGITGATSLVGHTTISDPSWSTILTGAWDSKTGVINNIFSPTPFDSWPTVINLIEYNHPDVTTAVFADWININDIGAAGGYPADINTYVPFDTSWENTDDLVTQATIDLINNTAATDSAFIFSYQVAVDEAGHAAGGDSPQYAAAVVNTSDNIRLILQTIAAWEAANPGQEWTVITTTDHGHQPQQGFGHGFQSPAETSSFVIFDLEGEGFNGGTQNLGYSNADITPTIVSLFGIAQRSDFDGVPLQTKSDGIVIPIDLKQSLTDALGNFGYPDVTTNIALGVRTIFGAIPYFLNIGVEAVTGFLQGVVDQEIFLISTLAGVAEFVVGAVGNALVGVTQAVAQVVGTLTGAGVIPPSDPPLPPPTAESLSPASAIPLSALV